MIGRSQHCLVGVSGQTGLVHSRDLVALMELVTRPATMSWSLRRRLTTLLLAVRGRSALMTTCETLKSGFSRVRIACKDRRNKVPFLNQATQTPNEQIPSLRYKS